MPYPRFTTPRGFTVTSHTVRRYVLLKEWEFGVVIDKRSDNRITLTTYRRRIGVSAHGSTTRYFLGDMRTGTLALVHPSGRVATPITVSDREES